MKFRIFSALGLIIGLCWMGWNWLITYNASTEELFFYIRPLFHVVISSMIFGFGVFVDFLIWGREQESQINTLLSRIVQAVSSFFSYGFLGGINIFLLVFVFSGGCWPICLDQMFALYSTVFVFGLCGVLGAIADIRIKPSRKVMLIPVAIFILSNIILTLKHGF